MAEETKRTFVDTIREWPLSRKISLAAVALLSLAIFGIIILQSRVADYRLLYANLSATDASSVITWLKEQKISYRLEDGGKAIHIPADKVYECRLDLAGAGLPQGGGVGFEIFDKQSFGITDFAQKINYQRALQGELSRTISSLAPVQGARVHLALPEKRLFKDQQKEATASVILKLSPGQELKENQIQGILHLVAGSIEGLEAENVAVIDSTGRVLSKTPREGLNGPMTPGMLDYQQTVERRLENRAQSLLDRALGAGNSLVRVTAELDFAQVERMEEIYDPNGNVTRSEQISEEKSGAQVVGGVPGVQSNLQNDNGFVGSVPSSRTSETANYEVSKVVNRVVAPVGTVKNLSVAVLVADRHVPGADGQKTPYLPRSDKEVKSIGNMITSALGLDEGRGDQIKVVSMPFEGDLYNEPMMEPAAVHSVYEYLPFVKYGLLCIGGVLLYFLLIRPVVKTLRGESLTQHYKTVQELEAEFSDQNQLPAPNDPTQQLRQEILGAQTSPAQVIKAWLKED
jgi:flagellar M-ring protein FliF